MPPIDPDEAYRQGHEAGGQLRMAAIDCPYLPPDPLRTAWMNGFSANRASVSAASDPCRAERGRPAAGARLPPLHEG